MINYKKVYLKAMGYDFTDYIGSELSGNQAVDLHHIVNREDRIENLMALTREEHISFGDKKHKMFFLLLNHRNFLDMNGVSYDVKWFDRHMSKYRELA